MSRTTVKLTPEQQELLDSGLRMLAHMIAETHLRRTSLRKIDGKAPQAETTERTEHSRETPEESPGENQSESYHE